MLYYSFCLLKFVFKIKHCCPLEALYWKRYIGSVILEVLYWKRYIGSVILEVNTKYPFPAFVHGFLIIIQLQCNNNKTLNT